VDKFVLEPNTRDVIQQHYLPIIVNSAGVSLPIAFNTASAPSPRPCISKTNTHAHHPPQLLHQLLVKKEEGVAPPLPLPSRKKRITVKDNAGKLLMMPEDKNCLNFNPSHLPSNHAFLLIGNNLVSASSLPPGTTIVMAPSSVTAKDKRVVKRKPVEGQVKRVRKKSPDDDGLKKRSKKSDFIPSMFCETEMMAESQEEVVGKKRRRRKAKGFLTHNLDHDYGGHFEDKEDVLEESTTINDVIDEQGLIYSNTIEEVVVKMETTEDLESNYSSTSSCLSHSHSHSPPVSSSSSPKTGVILRESNEDSRGRLGSIGAANASTLANLSFRLGIRVEPESPKPGTKAEDVDNTVDPNLYLAAEGVAEGIGSAAMTVGNKKVLKKRRSPVKTIVKTKLNQQENRVKRRSNVSASSSTSLSSSLTSSSCFESKMLSDHDLTSIHDSLQGFLTDQHHQHNKRRHTNNRFHHHSSTTLSHLHLHHTREEDDSNEEDMAVGDGVDDDEGYDDYFDPVAVSRDSLFFDEILNTNSPFL